MQTAMAGWASNLRKPLLAGLIAGAVTAVITLFIPNQYRSEARILPADQRSLAGSLGGMAAAAAAVGVSIPGQESADAAYVDILNSRWLREGLLTATYTFRVRSWYFGAEREYTGTLLQYLRKSNLDRGVKALKDHITISRDLKTKLLTVQVETASPLLSQQVAKRAVKLLEEFVVQKSKSKGGNKARFAEQRLMEARQAMEQAEAQFRDFLNVNRNYQVSQEPATRLRGLRLEAELRLHQQLVTTLTLGREQALMEEKNDMPILNVLDGGNFPLEKSWPPRSLIVILTALLAAATAWAYLNRKWVRYKLEADGEPDNNLVRVFPEG